ncbi:hypothetical protein IAD21_03115 [Abditibacteriota bacterium]|nr:hypothetical protein IAD21_03115 [Abditibacteriota bacterium]
MKSTFKILALIVAFSATVGASSPSFAQEKGRVETSLLGLFPLGSPSYQKFDGYYLVRGKIFGNAIVQHVYENGGSATYETDKQYDVFEADIANTCSSPQDQIRFFVLGDGNVIYRSRRLTIADKPIHISVPIKQYKGVTLVTQAYFYGGLPSAVWADPKLVNIGRDQTRPIALTLPSPSIAPSPSVVLPLASGNTITLSDKSDGTYKVTVNGKAVSFGYVQPTIKEGTLLVPMRPLFEALGATVTFGDDHKVILATRGGDEIKMQLGSTSAYVNGQFKPLDVPAQSLLGTTLVPLRFVSEAFGAQINFAQIDNLSPESSNSNPLP